MYVYGQLIKAQLEEVASASPTPAARSRMYSNISDTSNAIPMFHDGTSWVPIQRRRRTNTSVSTTYTQLLTDEIIFGNATGAAFTITMVAASTMTGQTVIIQKTDSSFNAITLARAGSDTFDGAVTSIKLSTKGEYVELLSTGSGWTAIGWGYYTGKIAWTPTGSWVSNSTYTGFWWREGNKLNFEVHILLAGAPTSATLTITLPTGTTIDTSQMLAAVAGFTPLPGSFILVRDDSAVDSFVGWPFYNTTTSITCKKDDGDGTVSAITQAAPMTFATLDTVDIVVLDLPMVGWRG
jgi:hypothetical protein